MKRATEFGIFAAACAGALFAASATADAPPVSDAPPVERAYTPRGAAPPQPPAPAVPTTAAVAIPTTAPAMATTTTTPSTNPATNTSTKPGTNPATGPASQPAGAAAKPFPPEFSLLLTRSPFARGVPAPQGQPGGPEANFGLRGVLLLDGQFTALIEELGSKRASRHKAGESVGPGKIKAITLDTIEYENAGTTRQVSIGQNLLGMPLPAQPPPPPPQPPAAQPGQPGGPPQPGQPGGPGGPPQGARVRRG